MIINFQKHKLEFNRLIQMLREDGQTLSVGWTYGNSQSLSAVFEKNGNKIDAARLGEYKKIFRQLPVESAGDGFVSGGITFDKDGNVKAVELSTNLYISLLSDEKYRWSSNKGFLWSILPPANLTTSELETRFFPNDDGKKISQTRLIEENWYLQYSSGKSEIIEHD